MLSGTKSVESLATGAPTMAGFDAEPALLEDVQILEVLHEISSSSLTDVLPSGLHPTIPPLVTWMTWSVGDSPFGAFSMAQTRIECRSGARPRAFLVSAVVDSDSIASTLSSQWGFATKTGTIDLHRSYDRVAATVSVDGRVALDLEAIDPVPLRPGDVQWISNMHLANTPRGLRLVQVDPKYDVTRAERARPIVKTFDAAAWGEPLIEPTYAVAAAFATATVTLPKVRFLCAPDQPAFFGTEVIGA
jgi:hypothetical protein